MLAKPWLRSPVLIAVAFAVALSGCAVFKKKSKEDVTYQEQPVDQLYAAGAERLDRRQWGESVSYFKEVERQHPYSEWSRRAILMEAYAHYEANQYSDAITDAGRFIDLYPGNPSAAYAYYLRAQCYFEQILDVNRDQAATGQSLAAMREVLRRYPHTEYAEDARLKVDMINDQLAGKEMTVGRWYLRQGDTLAAIGRFKGVVDHYQTTGHTPEALYRLVEAYLTLGLVEEAKRNAAVLGYNFPGDQWYLDAYNLMNARGYRPAVEPAPRKQGLLPSLPPFPFHHEKTETLEPPIPDTSEPRSRPYYYRYTHPGEYPQAAPATSPAPQSDAAPTAAPKKKKHGFKMPWDHRDDSPAAASASASTPATPAPAGQ